MISRRLPALSLWINKTKPMLGIFMAGIFFSCTSNTVVNETAIVQKNGKYQLLRNGEAYFINGAGGQLYLDKLASYGGNSFRLWSVHSPQGESGKSIDQILDEADSLDLTVTMGLWVMHPRHDRTFYDDSVKVKEQLERFRQSVRMYRDHPAVLMWAVGNEVHLASDDNRVWDAVGDIVRMIKEEDPRHVVTTVLAGPNPTAIGQLNEKVPELDVVGINIYDDDLSHVPSRIREAGWDRAYFLGEYGPRGPWMMPKTPWGASIEPNPERKLNSYIRGFESCLEDEEHFIGSYAFLWGWKWEKTYSWFNLFTHDGQETASLDAMEYIWKGYWPENRSPLGGEILVEGIPAEEFIPLKAGGTYTISIEAIDPESDEIRYNWYLYPEGTSNARGGDPEEPKKPMPVETVVTGEGEIEMIMPSKEGAYRIYAYVADKNQRISISNYPILLEK